MNGCLLQIPTTEELESLALEGSPSYVNQALRTLRRLLGKAVEWKVIFEVGAEEINLEDLRAGLQPEKDRMVATWIHIARFEMLGTFGKTEEMQAAISAFPSCEPTSGGACRS